MPVAAGHRAVRGVRRAAGALALIAVLAPVPGCGGAGAGGPTVFVSTVEAPLPRRAGPVSIAANHEAWGPERDRPRVLAMPIEASPRGSAIDVGVPVENCGEEEDGPSIDRIEVLKGRAEIVVTAYVAYPPPYGPGYAGGCPEVVYELPETVELGEPVGGRPIYDGVRWPPVKRWPFSG